MLVNDFRHGAAAGRLMSVTVLRIRGMSRPQRGFGCSRFQTWQRIDSLPHEDTPVPVKQLEQLKMW